MSDPRFPRRARPRAEPPHNLEPEIVPAAQRVAETVWRAEWLRSAAMKEDEDAR